MTTNNLVQLTQIMPATVGSFANTFDSGPHPFSQVEHTLPAELRSAIVSLCSIDALPSLARASREYQLLAEQILYSAIVIRTFNKQIGALETLAATPSRAASVKFLSVEFYRQDKGSDVAVMAWLLSALPFMKNLKDFRIKMRRDLRSYVDDLDDALW